eukprot:Hpha_TRINITY_DN20019_c0_g1::TRINITY_DN20019_c0_g1_i1::g.147839::m.147839
MGAGLGKEGWPAEPGGLVGDEAQTPVAEDLDGPVQAEELPARQSSVLPRRPVNRAERIKIVESKVARLAAESTRYDRAAAPLIDEANALCGAAEAIERELRHDGYPVGDSQDDEGPRDEEGEEGVSAASSNAAATPPDAKASEQEVGSSAGSQNKESGGDGQSQSGASAETGEGKRRKSNASWALVFPVLGDDTADNDMLVQAWLKKQIECAPVCMVTRHGCPFSAEARKIIQMEGLSCRDLIVDELPEKGLALTQMLQEGCELSGGEPRYGLPVVWLNSQCIGALAELRLQAERGLLEAVRRTVEATQVAEDQYMMFDSPTDEVSGGCSGGGGRVAADRPETGPPGQPGKYKLAPPPPPVGCEPTGSLAELPPRRPLLLTVSVPFAGLGVDKTNLFEALGPRVLWKICSNFALAAHSSKGRVGELYKMHSKRRRIAVAYCSYLCERLGGPPSTRITLSSGKQLTIGSSVLCCPFQLSLKHRYLQLTEGHCREWVRLMEGAVREAEVGSEA